MPAPTFDTVLPRVSDFHRRLREAGLDARSPSSGHGSLDPTLNPSLLQDLQRFDVSTRTEPGLEVLEVVAASLRHSRALRLLVSHADLVLPLTVMPLERVVRAPLPLAQWELLDWADMKVLQVESATTAFQAEHPAEHHAPLGLVLWALALQGSRAQLLPEIAGPVAYRIAPSADFSGLHLTSLLAAAVARLRRQTTPLHELSRWPGLDTERATRLLNGLYLQSGLIVTRSNPAAARPH